MFTKATSLMLLGMSILIASANIVLAQDAPLFTLDFPPEEFAARRAKVYDAIGPNAVAVLQGEATVRGFV